jgi:hypothetical protein
MATWFATGDKPKVQPCVPGVHKRWLTAGAAMCVLLALIVPAGAQGATFITRAHAAIVPGDYLSIGPLTATTATQLSREQVGFNEPFSYYRKTIGVWTFQVPCLNNVQEQFNSVPPFTTTPYFVLADTTDLFGVTRRQLDADGEFIATSPLRLTKGPCENGAVTVTEIDLITYDRGAVFGIPPNNISFPSPGCYQIPATWGTGILDSYSGSLAQIALGDVSCQIDNTVPGCLDGQDNDGDAKIDYPYDPQCGSPTGGETTGAISTSTTYTGDHSVQYSDPASLAGKLEDKSVSPPTGVSGMQLDFALGTQGTSASPTDSSGNAAISMTVLQKPGSASTVTASFAGASNYGPSSDTDPFSIAKEDCTLTYAGDTLVAPVTSTTFAADMGEPDSSLGDRFNKTVTFTVTDADNHTEKFDATTNANGHAETTQPLPANVYGVSVSFAGDEYYKNCQTATDTLVTVQAAAAKVTGGGWISIGTSRTSFGFNAIPEAGGLFKGQFQLRSNNGKSRFHGNVVTALTSVANTATWSGTGYWNGAPGYKYTISVVDNGSSGSKKGDTISVTIKNASNVIVYSTAGAQTLKGGNITVH